MSAIRPAPPSPADPSVTPPPRKTPARLQERRGSNLSLLLDVSSLGGLDAVCNVSTPKEVWLQLLHTSSRPLSHSLLQEATADQDSLDTEYQKIPLNYVNPADLDAPGHLMKDRYKTILPNPESRVILKDPEDDQSPERYINANHIRGYQGAPRAFIATQGPMVHTVGDFWEMVWQERSSVIVMVTRLKENDEKCEPYWPTVDQEEPERREEEDEEDRRTRRFSRFVIKLKESHQREGFTVTDMQIQLGSECRPVRHYWFTSWPDHHIPQCITSLLKLVEEVEMHQKSSSASQPITASSRAPVIVHCSAGIGRTGCFIASSIGCRQLRETGQVDLLEIVCKLRLDRGGMIQTVEQYRFLYATLAQYSRQLQDGRNRVQDQLAPEQQNQQNPEDQINQRLHGLRLQSHTK